ncbi:hypothetical protein KKG05_06425 [bacterium]|nr:hypothetical protein [bacterium]
MYKRLPTRFIVLGFLLTALIFFLPQLFRDNPQRDPVKKPNDWFMLQRMWPQNNLNRADVEQARVQALKLNNQSRSLDDTWNFAGPSNVGGRITALAVHPSTPDTVYAGAALGGVFKSTDGGLNYTPVFSDDFALSTGALAMDPSNPSRVWLGTGEANSSGDSYGGCGVYLTEDNGVTWQHKGLEAVIHVGKIAVDPSNSDRVFVAAAGELFGTNPERGLYRTTNSGDTWERVLFLTDSTACIDVALDVQHPDTVYAVMWERIRRPYQRQVGGVTSGIWRSFDGGDTWTQLTNGLPSGTDVGRGGITVSTSNPNRLYASFADHPGYLLGIYRSFNYGNSWEEVTYISSSLYSSFGWYFGQIHTDPVNPDVVYVQGVSMYRSSNAGTNWSEVFPYAHVDHHALWIDPNNPAHLITGHDGGIDVSYNTGASSSVFEDLPVTQFYAITADPTLPYRLYGGTQDNSTPRTLGGATDDWDVIYYGDGFYTLVDPRNSNVIYAEYQYGGLGKSTNGGYGWSSIDDDFYGDRTNWMTPYTMDPQNPDILYLGTYRIWKTTNGGSNWTSISSDLTDGPGPGNLTYGTMTTVDVSPVNSQVIYAGTDDAHVWVTTNGGSNWTDISAGLPQRWVTRVTPHPDSVAVVYVSLSGYKEIDYIPHLLRSSNYGANWTDISANLPEAPINDIIVDPDYPSYLYVGTDFGVFYSWNDGQDWAALGNNLPTSSVFDIHLTTTRELVAGTHGRSMWKFPLGSAPSGAPEQLVILIESGNAVLHWSPAGGETIFTIYGSEDIEAQGDSLTTVSGTTWTDTNLNTRPARYFYQVQAR